MYECRFSLPDSLLQTGIDAIRISSADPRAAGCLSASSGCFVWIAVTGGYKVANYTITINDGAVDTQLLADTPALGDLYSNGTALAPSYFYFTAAGRTLSSLPAISFTLNAIGTFGFGSSPTMYVASDAYGTSKPDPNNASTYCASSSVAGSSGRAYVLIDQNDPNPIVVDCICNIPANHPCNYYVAVVPNPSNPDGTVDQSFTITASQQVAPVTTLIDGIAAGNDATYQQLDQYVFQASFDTVTARVVRVATSPLVGSVQLFATVDGSTPTDTNFAYQSTRWSAQNEIAIRYYDAAVQSGPCGGVVNSNTTCPIKIAVYTSTTRSSYQVTARLSSAYRLTNGLSVQDYAWPNGYARYYLPIGRPNATTKFSLAVTSGFAYLLVGSDAVNGTSSPVPTDPTTYFINTYGSETPAFQTASLISGQTGFCGPLPCNYYVTVVDGGGSNSSGSSFTLTVKQDGSTYQLLELNVPTVDSLAVPSIPPYNAYIIGYPEAVTGGSPSTSLSFAIDVQPGTYPRINASVTSSRSGSGANSSQLSPATAQYSWMVRGSDASATFTIYSTDAAFNASCLSQISSVTRYNTSCYIVVWVLPDPAAGPASGWTSTYAITPFAGSRQLIDGQVVSSYVGGYPFYTYFRYTVVSLLRPLTVSVTPLTGDPDLYLGIGYWPNSVNYTIGTSSASGPEVIQVTWDSNTVKRAIAASNLTTPFDVNIGVAGGVGPSTFTIQASTTGVDYLTPNLPTTGFVKGASFSYYYIAVPPGNTTTARGLILSFASLSATPIIVVVNNVLPMNGTNSTGRYPLFPRCTGPCTASTSSFAAGTFVPSFSSFNQPIAGSIDIDPSDPAYLAGVDYVVGVYAAADTPFTITGSYVGGVRALQSGVPQAGQVQCQAYNYYKFNVVSDFDAIVLTLQQQNGVNPQINSVLLASTSLRRPSITNYTKMAKGTTVYAPDVITFNSTDLSNSGTLPPCYAIPGGCTIYVSVYASVASGGPTCPTGLQPTPYTITAQLVKNSSFTTLIVGQPAQGSLAPNTAAFYQARPGLPDTSTPVSITLSPTSGNVDMFITTDGSTPGPGNTLYNATAASGVDYVVFSGLPVNATIKIAVVAPPSNVALSSYYIWYSAGANAISQVYSGVPVDATVEPGAYNYYYFLSTSTDDITFALTAGADTNPNLFVASYANIANNTAFRPGPGFPTFNCGNSTRDGGDFVIVPGLSSGTVPLGPNAGNYAYNCRNPSAGPGGMQSFLIGITCASLAQCRYSFVARAGDVTPILLAEGRPQTVFVTAGNYSYVAFDLTNSLGAGRNVTIAASTRSGGGHVSLYGTNRFIPGQSNPLQLPTRTGNALWSYPGVSGQPPSASGSIMVGTFDASVLACPPNANTSCGVLVVGVSLDSDGRADVVAFSAGGPPIQLQLGVASPVSGLAANTSRTFLVNIADPTQDLFLSLSALDGGPVAVSISPSDPATTCAYSSASPSGIACSGVWAMYPNSTSTPVAGLQATILANNPCLTANGMAPCTNASSVNPSWRPGPYYVTVFATSNVVFTVTAQTVATPVLLGDGVPVDAGSCTSTDRALYDYQPPPLSGSASIPPIRFLATALATPVNVFINSCVDGACSQADMNPAQGAAKLTIAVPANTAVSSTINASSVAWCPAPFGSFCHYYIAVLPAVQCNLPTCSATFSLTAIQQSGAAPLEIPFASIAGTVAAFTWQSIPFRGSQPYQFFLDPSNGANDLKITLDACTNGYSAIYGCNPSASSPCGNSYKPSAMDNNGAARTAGPSGKPWSGGRATFVMRGITSPAAFATLYDDNSSALGSEVGDINSGGPVYSMLVSASTPSRPAFYLTPGQLYGVAGGISLTQVGNSSDVFIQWAPAVIVDALGTPKNPNNPNGTQNVVYLIYVARGGFNATPGTIAGSSCGLDVWSLAAGVGPVIVTGGRTNYTYTGLMGAGHYEVQVVAQCTNLCWAVNSVLEPVSQTSLRVGSGGRVMQAVQTITQSAPYNLTDFTSSVKPQPPGPDNSPPGLSPAVIGGAAGGAVAFLCIVLCFAGWCCRRRRLSVPKENIKADDRAARVAQLNLGAVPSAPSAANAAAAAELGRAASANADKASFAPVVVVGNPVAAAASSGAPVAGNVAGWK